MGSHTTLTALHLPYVSVRWRDGGQKRPYHVTIKIKLITKYTIVVFDGSYKKFVYLVYCICV